MIQTPDSQRAVSRKRGSNPADNFVRNCTLLPRSKCSETPACVKPLGRCTQAGDSTVDKAAKLNTCDNEARHSRSRKSGINLKTFRKGGSKAKNRMATTVAKYQFDNSNDYDNAREKISNEVGYYSNNGWDYENSYYYIYVYDSCEKASLIGQICRAHGGKSC